MDAATIIALVFGVIAIVSAVIGSAWRISGRISHLDATMLTIVDKANETHKLIHEHTSDCDTNRAELDVKAKSIVHTVDDHGRRIGKLETT